MKLKNDTQSLEIKNNQVIIRDNGKRYVFEYTSCRATAASDSLHYAWYHFDVPAKAGYKGSKYVVSSLSVGICEMLNEVTFGANYIRELKTGNKAVFLGGSFKTNGTKALEDIGKVMG